MSWSLKIRNGDFDVQGAQIAQVRGAAKLVQDFTCAVLEVYGSDDMQPAYGSTLDGGLNTDGSYRAGILGSADSHLVRVAIETEIRRIASQIQDRQLNRVRAERLTYNKTTLTASEILVGVSDIRFRQVGTALTVFVTLLTGSGPVDLPVPLTSTSSVAS